MRKKTASVAARTLIGYWHDDYGDSYSHPQPLVNHAWETAHRGRIVKYLKSGYVNAYGCGHSYCRCGCTEISWTKTDDPSKGEYREMRFSFRVGTDRAQRTVVERDFGHYIRSDRPLHNGNRFYCDDVWCWPEGLAHYVETHGIRLPDEFVAHAAARDFRASGRVANPETIRPDDRFWREWCKTNAPFAYESHCLACRAAPALMLGRAIGQRLQSVSKEYHDVLTSSVRPRPSVQDLAGIHVELQYFAAFIAESVVKASFERDTAKQAHVLSALFTLFHPHWIEDGVRIIATRNLDTRFEHYEEALTARHEHDSYDATIATVFAKLCARPESEFLSAAIHIANQERVAFTGLVDNHKGTKL